MYLSTLWLAASCHSHLVWLCVEREMLGIHGGMRARVAKRRLCGQLGTGRAKFAYLHTAIGRLARPCLLGPRSSDLSLPAAPGAASGDIGGHRGGSQFSQKGWHAHSSVYRDEAATRASGRLLNPDRQTAIWAEWLAFWLDNKTKKNATAKKQTCRAR